MYKRDLEKCKVLTLKFVNSFLVLCGIYYKLQDKIYHLTLINNLLIHRLGLFSCESQKNPSNLYRDPLNQLQNQLQGPPMSNKTKVFLF